MALFEDARNQLLSDVHLPLPLSLSVSIKCWGHHYMPLHFAQHVLSEQNDFLSEKSHSARIAPKSDMCDFFPKIFGELFW